jgi:hypothetical protein
VTPGKRDVNVNKWARVSPGDTALFSREGFIFASATVAATLRSPLLAERLWHRNDDGETWECIYFLDELKRLAIPYAAFNPAAGYRPRLCENAIRISLTQHSGAIGDFGPRLPHSGQYSRQKAFDGSPTRRWAFLRPQ